MQAAPSMDEAFYLEAKITGLTSYACLHQMYQSLHA